MSANEDALSPISFTFEYAGHGWARSSISDGTTTYYMAPSYVPNDPLFDLVHAVVEVLTYGGTAGFGWHYEPSADRWTLRREGDRLDLVIRVGRDFPGLHWPEEGGKLQFAATCEVWKFAAKVRLAVSRLTPVGESYWNPSSVQHTGEYRALCMLLDEHKRALRSPTGKRSG